MTRKIYKVDDELVQVHTTLTEKEREEICTKGWEYNELIRLGVLAKKDNPQLISRVGILEKKLEYAETRIQLLLDRSYMPKTR